MSQVSSMSRLTQSITLMRRVIPLVLAALGLGYTFWEVVVADGFDLFSIRVIIGLILLGILGPLLTFFTLEWARRASAALESSEQERERHRQQLLVLNSISDAVHQSLDLDAVLDRALDRVLELMRLESGEVRLIEEGRLVLRASRGVSADFVATERFVPLGQCVCGMSAQTGELIAIEDIGRVAHLERQACACERFRSVLSVPVRTADRIVGAIHVASRDTRAFDAADRTLLTAIGQQVGAAIEKAQLHAELVALNRELEMRVNERTTELVAAKEELAHKADALHQVLVEERRVEEKTRARIAHDLHDGVQQLIIGALFETQAARDALALNVDTVLPHLLSAQDLLRRIESEMRGAIYSLRPLALDAHGLVPALREYAVSFERVARVSCDLHVEGAPRRFDPDAEVAVFRIVQEALNNVESHAHAARVDVRVHFNNRDLRVAIEDDGAGFDIDEITQQARTQLGLIGMQERAQSVKGVLAVWSHKGEGTRVELTLPVG